MGEFRFRRMEETISLVPAGRGGRARRGVWVGGLGEERMEEGASEVMGILSLGGMGDSKGEAGWGALSLEGPVACLG